MSKSSKIVDLEIMEDGTYSTKDTLNISNISKLKSMKPVSKKKENKPKPKTRNNADDFMDGIDAGLDFLEGVGFRVDRFLKLKR